MRNPVPKRVLKSILLLGFLLLVQGILNVEVKIFKKVNGRELALAAVPAVLVGSVQLDAADDLITSLPSAR